MQATSIEAGKKIKDFNSPTPINRESRFEYNELFFSITDPKSTITYANDVFVRISKYEVDEVVGQLHKLIRHPDMPRSVFFEFWEHLKQDKPVAAYVKNMAKDGSYYWVMALAFPCDGGYLSVRLKPGSDLFKTVKDIYKTVLDHEKKQESVTDKKSAMHSSHDLLISELEKIGFSSYDEFMWGALQNEMEHRESILESNDDLDKHSGEYVPKDLLKMEVVLRELVLELGQLRQIHTSLIGHSDYILNLSRTVLLLSKNAQISSAKLDQQDRSISVVAENMGEQSMDGETHLIKMQNNIFELSKLIGGLNFNIISSKLQAEMTKYFLTEINETNSTMDNQLIPPNKALGLLYNEFLPTIDDISSDLEKLPDALRQLLKDVREIERFLLVLRFIQIKGKVEIARMNDGSNSFSNTFQELINEVNSAEKRLEKLGDIIRTHEKTGVRYAGYKGRLTKLAARLKNYRKEHSEDETCSNTYAGEAAA